MDKKVTGGNSEASVYLNEPPAFSRHCRSLSKEQFCLCQPGNCPILCHRRTGSKEQPHTGWVYDQRFVTRAEARTAIFDYIETCYNRTRLRSSLAYTSPINFESMN